MAAKLLLTVLLAAALTQPLAAFAQGAGSQDNVWDVPRTGGDAITQPSPEATAMRRYQDYPVTYATGTADISIPLLELPGGAASVSLGLSYHTGGIRKNDISTSVGLGWTLTGLGSVSRQINGLPDEWRGYANDVKFDFNPDPYHYLDYLRDFLESKIDAEYDCYNYNIPGYSGTFYIVDGDVRQFPASELIIVPVHEYPRGKGDIERFEIHTPDGLTYTLEEKEYIDYRNLSTAITVPVIVRDYTAVSQWNLTKVVSRLSPDSITVSYTPRTEWARIDEMNLSGYNFSYHVPSSQFSHSESAPLITSDNRTTFRNHSIPRLITTNSGSIQFTTRKVTKPLYSTAPVDYIAGIKLKDSSGKLIRQVSLENTAHFLDGRLKLTGLDIETDGVLTERYQFEYNDKTGNKGFDFFGFPNGKGTEAGFNYSVLDGNLNFSAFRQSDTRYIADNCLTGITDITGLTTTIEYEPVTIPVIPTYTEALFRDSATVGIRINSITTVDPVTGRTRKRSYSYDGASCSVPLEELIIADFVSQSGSHVFSGPVQGSTYSMGVTYTPSATLKGLPAEHAAVYYGTVTETLSGTGLDNPIVTEYEYDLSNLRSVLMRVGQLHEPEMYEFGNTAEDAKSLGSFAREMGLHTEVARFLSRSHPSRGYLTRTIGASPLLVRRTEKEWTPTGYRINTVEQSFYSRTDRNTFTCALFCESLVFRYLAAGWPSGLNITSFEDMNYFYIDVSAYRSVLDSTVVTRHYPDGRSRSTRTAYINSTPSGRFGRFPGFFSDSIHAPAGVAYRPLGKIVSSGSESIASYTACTGNISNEYYDMTLHGLSYLPVVEKWVVNTPEGRDSMLRQTYYAPSGSNGLPRPRRVWVETAERNAYARALISEQRYHCYDPQGRITSMTDASGRRDSATWHPVYNQLLSMSLPDVGLTSTYTYQPLVGCTSITSPSGRKRQFSYHGGRLASESNTAGLTVATYSYRMYGDDSEAGDPANRFTSTIHDSAGTASSVVDYDGFGMPVRTVTDVAGGGQTATGVEYDALDRPVRQYLPVPVSGGSASSPADYYGDPFPYRSTTYRAMRSDQPLSIIGEGALMQSHPTTVQYLCNSATDPLLRCRRYTLAGTASESVTLAGNYPAGSLDVTDTTDPDGHRVLTFTDWRGFRVLERRVLGESVFSDTYWLYDPMGRVRVVLQPEGSKLMSTVGASWNNSSAPIRQFAFISRYDRRGNSVYSLVPGGGPVRMAYDPLGRLALRQSAVMAEQGRAEFLLYDPIGRPAVTGIMSGEFPASGDAPLASVTFGGAETGLCNCGYSVTDPATAALLGDVTLTNVTYYDSYVCRDFAGFSRLSSSFDADAARARGLVTGTRTAVYDHDADNGCKVSGYLYTLCGYDDEERVTCQVETTALSGAKLSTNTTYTRQGHPSFIEITLNTADSIYSVQMSPDYDATGSLLHEGVVVNTGYCPSRVQPASEIPGNQAVVGYSYDPLGRLSGKLLNSGKSIGYQYNLRGQLTGISHPVFSQSLFYENGANPCYNGNISGIRLRYGDGPVIDRAYSYDNLNRLTSLTSSDGYNTAYSYNLNSSPLTIQRYGLLSDRSIGLVDDLELSYSGNRPLCVSDYAPSVLLESSLDFDAGDDGEALYGYDADGRLISDTGRGITSISYTPGNLPVRTTVKGGTFDCSYSADGRKLKTVTDYLANVAVAGGGTTRPGFGVPKDSITDPGVIGDLRPTLKGTPEERYYIGPFELVKPSYNGLTLRAPKPGLARINMSWGYFDSEGNNNEYVTDYQGNVRAVTRGDEVVQTTDYYPYGLPMANSTGAAANRYKYTGKEFETRAGLNTYDFQARQYGPQFPFFSTTDSRAWDYHNLNPFLFCAANPILNTDPTGERYSISTYNDNICIRANLYVMKEDAHSAKLSASFWNSQSGNFMLNDGRIINFDINVKEMDKESTPYKDAENTIDTKRRIVLMGAQLDDEQIGNAFYITDEIYTDKEKNENTNGGTGGSGCVIKMKSYRADNEETTAHEAGHVLGLGHFDSGLMTPDSSNEKRSLYIGTKEIKAIVKGAVLGEPLYKGAGKGIIIPAGGNSINIDFEIERIKQEQKQIGR